MKFHRPHCFGALALVFLCGAFLVRPAVAREPRTVAVTHTKDSPDSEARMEGVRIQVLLDRAFFRPGKIDGLGGEFTQKAADRFLATQGQPPGTRIDTSGIANPYRDYTVSETDMKWIGPQASTPQEQEKLKAMKYVDAWELVAERFHCDLDFLHELNPHVPESPGAGTVFRVPDVQEFIVDDVLALEKKRRDDKKAAQAAASASPSEAATPTPAPVYRMMLSRKERLIELYENDKMVGCFPCTPGSPEIPVPEGTWKVVANVLMPTFRWDKSVLETGVKSDTAYELPSGPNNPVGIVWMAINRPSVGIHGTPSPDQIGRNQSHGCIRTANWDAWILAQMVNKGTVLEVQ
ncbi:hypothetical protein BH09VER1_BH09VER1_10450 [soil metagenome]